MRPALGSLQSSEDCVTSRDERESLSETDPRANAAVLSIDRGKGASRKTLESHLASALRSEDSELDQILSALEEISNGLKSGVLNERSLDNALQRAASCAMRQSLLDREIRCLAVTGRPHWALQSARFSCIRDTPTKTGSSQLTGGIAPLLRRGQSERDQRFLRSRGRRCSIDPRCRSSDGDFP